MSSILNKTRAYTKEAQSGIYTGGGSQAGASPAQVTQDFARGGLGSEDPRDELMKEKMEFMRQSGSAQTPFGQITATDDDFKWLQKKRDTEAAANLDAWIGQNFHTGDVTTRKWLQEVYPDYYEVREREIMERAKFALRVKYLLLRGPKNPKDLILLWGLQTGQIALDRDWDRIGPAKSQTFDQAEESKRFKKGLFNPLRYLSDNERFYNKEDASNPFRPASDGPAGGQYPVRPFGGNGVPEVSRYPSFLSNLGI